MKVRERLLKEIRSDLVFAATLTLFIPVAFIWIDEMPRISGYLWGGVLLLIGKVALGWMKYRKTDPLLEESVARRVRVQAIDQSGLILKEESPVSWSDITEVRKVYRAIGSWFVIAFPKPSPVATRRFFYTIKLRNGQWLELSNVGFVALKTSFKERLAKTPEAAGLIRQFLTEAQKQTQLNLTSHDEANACSGELDLRKELDDLSELEKR